MRNCLALRARCEECRGDRGAPPDPSAAAGAMDGERMLAEALAAEASKAAKHSKDPFADLGVKFVEARPCCIGRESLHGSVLRRCSSALLSWKSMRAAPYSHAHAHPPRPLDQQQP